MRYAISTDSERFFLGLKSSKRDLTNGDPFKYFTKKNLGRNKFSSIVKRVCANLRIRGDGAHSIVTAHGLRGTMETLLIEAGYDDATITMRTGIETYGAIETTTTFVGKLDCVS